MVSSRHGRWSIGWNGGADGDGAFGRQERSNHWTMSKESTAVRRCFATLMMMPTIVTFTTDAEIFAWFQSENSGFLGGMWNFICEYLLKASVIQSVRAHTNRSRRHMILNEFPFAAFVRLLARIEIWIYILHSCVCDNNRILHIAYLLLMYRMRDHLAQMMWKMKNVISMPGCCLSHSSTIPHMAAQNIIIKFKLSGN